MSWMLNLLYLCAVILATPWLLYRRWRLGKRFGSVSQKLWGDLQRRDPERPCVWLHAVSVGEVVQLQSIVSAISARWPHLEILITTTTTTGYEVACRQFPQHTVAYWPLDFSWAVQRALRQLRPTAVVLVELELWPNFLRCARQCNVPVVVINGRISDRSFPAYQRLAWLWRRWLPQLHFVAAQNETYAARFRALGVPDDKLAVTGSIKFDRVETNRHNPRTEQLRQAFGISPSDRVFIAGSTQDPEEALALEAWQQLREEFSDLRLVLVPRHKERFESVAQLVLDRQLPLLRRSTGTLEGSITHQPPVLLLDTLGELGACWGLAEIAFVGGSLTRRGGQNMIEPAGYGAAILFGPHTQNFRDVVDQLRHAEAAQVVPTPEALFSQVRELLTNRDQAAEMGCRAQQLVLSQRGATQRTLDILAEVLDPAADQAVTRAA